VEILTEDLFGERLKKWHLYNLYYNAERALKKGKEIISEIKSKGDVFLSNQEKKRRLNVIINSLSMVDSILNRVKEDLTTGDFWGFSCFFTSHLAIPTNFNTILREMRYIKRVPEDFKLLVSNLLK
jgi:hypothetical protein